ncbi:hypothetical protein [Cellvibrio sp. PSBB023]|uniref:hypothetical protein n=1 Tax=Cellvibrio sp. PSBB023 TaxID=1945512 RepID=UPI00098FC63C|nr:hypothetical protein [Cellvibrio sp. PSBB023]AQT58731.1 hypothetical protein B0D95_00450 [Cellvibrio sp. PSBB023]
MDAADINRPKPSNKPRLNPGYTPQKVKPDQKPQAARMIFLLGVITLAMSAFLSMYTYRLFDNPLAFLCLFSGVVTFAFCAGFSAIINLLDEIRKNTDK